MFGFVILLYVIIAPVIFILTLVQALFVLISGEYNANLRYFGAALAEYVVQILHYISYNSDEKPFPFTDFPSVAAAADDNTSETGETVAKTRPKAAVKRKAPAKKQAVARKQSTRKSMDGKTAASKNTDSESNGAED